MDDGGCSLVCSPGVYGVSFGCSDSVVCISVGDIAHSIPSSIARFVPDGKKGAITL